MPRTEAANNRRRVLREKRLKAGLCCHCGVVPEEGKSYCASCRDRFDPLKGVLNMVPFSVVSWMVDQPCPICGRTMKKPVRDHDHEGNFFRGVICSGCNTMLGHVRDDTAVLASAIAYLNRFQKS
jgi:hypothetical protein